MTPPRTLPLRRLAPALAAGILALVPMLACHAGTPAAPAGTTIFIDELRYIDGTRDPPSGDFQALLRVRLLDSVSNVPQTGVGVYFLVDSGPGRFANPSPVVTTNAGKAENILIATGATSMRPVKVRVVSGEAAALTIDMHVDGFASEENFPPIAAFTVTPNPPRVNQDATVDVSTSSDADCPTGKPTSWTVSWGDGTATESFMFTTPTRVHRYAAANVMRVITVTVTDCDGLVDDATLTVNVAP